MEANTCCIFFPFTYKAPYVALLRASVVISTVFFFFFFPQWESSSSFVVNLAFIVVFVIFKSLNMIKD